MSQKLHQISVSYSPEEDRMLLILKTHDRGEYRIWLTRRYTRMMLNVVLKLIRAFGGMGNERVSEKVRDMHKSGAFSQPLEQETSSLPFGEDGILAYGLKTNQINDQLYALEIFSRRQQKVRFDLDRSNIVMLGDLLQQGLLKTDWNFSDLMPAREQVH